MAIWQIILYVAAAFLAVRSLASLMSQHRKNHVRRFLKRNQARLQHEATATKPADFRGPRFKHKRSRSAA